MLLTRYHLGDQIKTIEMGGECSTYGERRGEYRVLVGGPQRRMPLERSRRRWKDKIKMVL